MNGDIIRKIPRGFIRIEKESLAQFFGLSLIAYALLSVAIIFIAFARYERINEEKRIHTDGFTLVNLITAFARSSVESENKMDLYHVIDIVKREKGLLYCSIVDGEGSSLLHIGEKYPDSSVIDQITSNSLSTDHPLKQMYEDPTAKRQIYEFSKPIFLRGEKWGAVRLALTPQTPYAFSKLDVSSLALIILIAFPLTPLFYYLFRKAVRPLQILQKKLEEISTKSEVDEIKVKAKGEVGALTRQINKLITHFNKKHNATESVKKDLEISMRVGDYETQKIRAVLNQIDDAVLVTNASNKIYFINKSFENIFGVSYQKVSGNEVEESIHDETLITFVREGRNGLNGARHKKQVATHTIDGKGTFRLRYAPLQNVSGDGVGELIVAKDITSQTNADKAQGEFLSHASHEMLSPLNTIRSYTEMLMDGDVKDRDTEKEFYNVITMETERLAKLVEDLLNISKIEIGNLIIDKSMVKPLNLVEKCISVVMSQSLHKNIQIKKALTDSLSPVDADKKMLEVAILNFMSNALKYTPEGGTVTIQVEEDELSTLFSIKDTGIGIAEEELLHIFDKFYRSSDESVQKERGTGLGLSLAKEIISLHGGEVKVESTVGEGSTFTIILPRDTQLERMF